MRKWVPQSNPGVNMRLTAQRDSTGAPIWLPQSNGWFPLLSPTGRYIAFGFWQVFIADLVTGVEREIKPVADVRHSPIGWISDTEFVFTAERDSGLWRCDVFDWIPSRVANDTIGPANFYAADAGHVGASRAAPPRTLVDGRELIVDGQPTYGITLGGPYAATAVPTNAYRIALFKDWQLVANDLPASTGWRVNRFGDLTGTISGQAWLCELGGSVVDVTLSPSGWEGVPVAIRDDDDQLWIWSATAVGNDAYVLGRKVGETDAIVLRDFPAVALTVVENAADRSEFVIAGNDDRGRLQVRWVSKSTPRSRINPVVEPFPTSIAFGSFYAFSTKYGDDFSYPQNVTVVVTERDSDGRIVGLDHVKRAAQRAYLIITADDEMVRYIKANDLASRVYGLYIGDTNGAANAATLARESAARWRNTFGTVRPVIWYVNKQDSDRSDFYVPGSVDIVAPEFYFDANQNASALNEQRWRLLGYWMSKLGRQRPWMPICQAYDRGGTWGPDHMRALAALQPAFLDMLKTVDVRIGALPPATGILFFAVNRPGGARDYPAVRVWHEAMYKALPVWTPTIDNGGKVDPVKPKPVPVPVPPQPRYKKASSYRMTTETQRVALIGSGNKFLRIDPANNSAIRFDRKRDQIGEHETFEIAKGDAWQHGDRFSIRAVAANVFVGADATAFSPSIDAQFYTAPSVRGDYELWTIIERPSGIIEASVEYHRQGGENGAFVSASLTVVPL